MTFFTAEDFAAEGEWVAIPAGQAASIANAKLWREGKVVYICDKEIKTLHFAQPVDATHTGILICVELIERKPCEHEPVTAFHGSDDCFIPACRKCGVKLKAKWEVVE